MRETRLHVASRLCNTRRAGSDFSPWASAATGDRSQTVWGRLRDSGQGLVWRGWKDKWLSVVETRPAAAR